MEEGAGKGASAAMLLEGSMGGWTWSEGGSLAMEGAVPAGAGSSQSSALVLIAVFPGCVRERSQGN